LTPGRRAALCAAGLASLAVLASCSQGPRARGAAEPTPIPAPDVEQRGLASYYGSEFAGLPTASGVRFDPDKLTAAHRTLPLGTVVEVTNETNGKSVRVTINDRGPFKAKRIIDLSHAAAKAIGSTRDGVVPVVVRVLTVGDNRRVREESGSGWAVQAGAFASEENAQRLRDRLATRYPSPFLEEFAGLKRVKFGPYRTRPEAEAAAASLEEIGLAGIVVAYEPMGAGPPANR